MRVFVPMQDEWDSGVGFAGAPLVPYRVGIPVWRETAAATPCVDEDRARVSEAA